MKIRIKIQFNRDFILGSSPVAKGVKQAMVLLSNLFVDPAAQAKWLHSLTHKALINKSVSWFFQYSDWLFRSLHLNLECS